MSSRHRMQERKCVHCGECCRIVAPDRNGNPVRIAVYCPAWNPETRNCDVYHERRNFLRKLVGHPCMMADEQIKAKLQPTHCVYAPHGYKGLDYNAESARTVPWWTRIGLRFMTWRIRRKIVKSLAHGRLTP